MKKVLLILGILIVVLIIFFQVMNIIFYRKFRKLTDKVLLETPAQDQAMINEKDLDSLPPPVARWLRTSGIVGMKRISHARIYHSGKFKPGRDRDFMAIKGEYLLTTNKPSFVWYGEISIFPGLSVSARDYYIGGKGNMLVKVLGAFTVVDARSEQVDKSAFGRCVAEMTMVPTFFLDRERIIWTAFDENHAECTVRDSAQSTNARLYFNRDGSLAKITVDRYYDDGKGRASLEKFTGVCSVQRDFRPLKLNTVYDGYWELPEGELHYVHFVIDRVTFE